MNCCICGPVKNCGPYLAKVLDNMAKIGSLFDDYAILIYYDKSSDNTLNILKEYQNNNSKMMIYINQQPISPYQVQQNSVPASNTSDFDSNSQLSPPPLPASRRCPAGRTVRWTSRRLPRPWTAGPCPSCAPVRPVSGHGRPCP